MTDKSTKLESREITFEYLVKCVRLSTGYGYAKAAHLVDKAIEPHVKVAIANARQRLEAEMPKESHVTKRYSTSWVDRMAYDLAYNAALKEVNQAIKKVFESKMEE